MSKKGVKKGSASFGVLMKTEWGERKNCENGTEHREEGKKVSIKEPCFCRSHSQVAGAVSC